MMEQISIVAKRLKEARCAAGLSQKKLGIDAKIDASCASSRMNQYEKGTHMPDLLTMMNVAEALGKPLAYFYCEDDKLAEVILKFSALGAAERKQLLHRLAELG